jgi:hypothetical protein
MPRVVLAYLVDRASTRSPLVEVPLRDEIEIDGRRYRFRSIDPDGAPVYFEVPVEEESQVSEDGKPGSPELPEASRTIVGGSCD